MSTQDRNINPGADAMENNLAGTRDEFNDEVTARLVEEAKTKNKDKDSGQGEDREDQPALEVDKDSAASPAKPSS